jgi:signal transduction histidine kinase
VLDADADQVAQAIINLVKNGVEAAEGTGEPVVVGWKAGAGQAEILVEDRGPGLPTGGNLFVPFFTTKSGGSGIGLVLSRQIAEAHLGSLALHNRGDGTGVRAVLRIPLAAATGPDPGAPPR